LQVLENGAANPVDVEPGPDGDLYYVDFDGGTIHRISYAPTNTCSASDYGADYYNNTSLAGDPVLTRCESAIDYSWGTGSPGPGVDADDFSARWTAGVSFAPGSYTFTATVDDGIRVFVDGSLLIDHWGDQASPATYTAPTTLSAGVHEVRVEYYKATGEAVAHVSWSLDEADAPPEPVIDAPSPTLSYASGREIDFQGEATDPEDGPLPQSALSWTLLIHHCTTPTQCHVHVVQHWTGTDGETLNAPDHDYPSHLELVLRATDSLGATQTTNVTLDPRTVGSHSRPSRPASGSRSEARAEPHPSRARRSSSRRPPQRAGGPAVEREDLPLRVLVGRGRGDAQHHGACHHSAPTRRHTPCSRPRPAGLW
jgi:hypothetical protein